MARFRHEAPLQRSSPGPWQTEFMRQERTVTPPQHVQSQFSPGFDQSSYMGMNAISNFGPMQAGPLFQMNTQSQQTPAMQNEQFDEAAFAAAFDNAAAMFEQPAQSSSGKGKEKAQPQVDKQQGTTEKARSMVDFDLSNACVEPPEAFDYDTYQDASEIPGTFPPLREATTRAMWSGGLQSQLESMDRFMQHEEPLPKLREQFASDEVLQEENVNEQQMPEMEADALSRTAGQLLDNLKHEHSEKFANSNFMTLMRQLRDREVRVDGERFVEVSQAQEPDHGSRGEFSSRVWE